MFSKRSHLQFLSVFFLENYLFIYLLQVCFLHCRFVASFSTDYIGAVFLFSWSQLFEFESCIFYLHICLKAYPFLMYHFRAIKKHYFFQLRINKLGYNCIFCPVQKLEQWYFLQRSFYMKCMTNPWLQFVFGTSVQFIDYSN
jgi:hypothetical protein